MSNVASLPSPRSELVKLCARGRVVVVYEDPLSLRLGIQFALWLTARGGLGGPLVPVKLSNAPARQELDDILGADTGSALFIFSMGNRKRLPKADVAGFAQLVARDHAAQKRVVVLQPCHARHQRSLRSTTMRGPAFDLGCFAAWPIVDGGEFDIRCSARVTARESDARSLVRSAATDGAVRVSA